MDLETWTMGLQLISLGFIAGLILGDWLDKADPLHWKYHVRFGSAKQMQPRTLSDEDLSEDESDEKSGRNAIVKNAEALCALSARMQKARAEYESK